MAEGLAAVAGRLPADKGAAVCGQAADARVAALAKVTGEQVLIGGLSAATCGLSESNRIHRKYRTELTAVAGITVLHPDVLPTPRPLPPQQLVDLLKHPFCVKEMRRAVLDALEFTYDRPFADLWEFVAFAEAHPELKLDLLTPPKRPEKR